MKFLKLQVLALVAVFCVFTTASSWAQVPAPAAQAAPESLLIGPGDMLHITVFDTPELEQHARVDDSGNVPLVFLGNVHVAGMSPEQAARTIETQLEAKEYMKHPQVTVNIETFATQSVLVIGQVTKPGPVQIDTSRTVLDVLGLAGGLTDLADRKITIERHGTGERIVYFVSNKPEEAFDHSILIHPGDKIMVPKAGIVYALGDFNKPGGFTMTTNDGKLTAVQMMAMAGGTPPTARPAAAKLVRRTADGYTETNIQLSDMQKGKIADIQLQPDDIIFVPYSYLKNMAVNINSIVAAGASASVYAIR